MNLQNETLSFMQQLWGVVHAMDVRSKRMRQTLGVTGAQRLVIRMLGKAPGLTASELSTTLGIDPSTLTGILARLGERDLITRHTDPEDGRRARFKLTSAGQRVDREKRGTVEAAVRRALNRADDATVESTVRLLGLLTEELARE